MKYEFPVIKNISQVLPLIKDKPEFVVAVKDGGYTVVNYIVMTSDTFPAIESEGDAILRELRGIIFETATGNIIRRPFHKFFNLMEREETQVNNIDFTASHTVFTKLDGSMIVPFTVEGKLIYGTKMVAPDFHKAVSQFVKESNINYESFCREVISEGYSPIFEFTSPTNRIVLSYSTTNLTLLAIRHIVTGEYVTL